MSRVGKHPVELPQGVTVAINDGVVTAKGKLGELKFSYDVNEVEAKLEDNKVWVKPLSSTNKARALWGTTRAQINNLVVGVSEGFTKQLEMVGVGYKARTEAKKVVLSLGYSHDIDYPIPEGITVKCDTPTTMSISGADKQVVGQIAAEIRAFRSPEPYKGKGVKYAGERILRKEGKKK